ncbi:hypothetical protein KP509_35G045800 [Ceratopteris richardii]|uniref:SEC7 domain-containing protein n=1 Tax=Ceratopteris richardii TaxID=49495 RepID=A0A8T2QFR9_CERRI|nr:hypothetical protein KP509_35G045800 [Ceratopteris richardii]
MAEAAGSFVTRAFERMLKDSSVKKNAKLQKALKAYLERTQKHEHPSSPGKSHEKDKSSERQGTETDSTPTSPTSSATSTGKDVASLSATSISAATALAKAGHTLEISEAEIVLLPLRIAFETKQPKLVEPALDCLHKLISYEHLEGDAGLEGGKNSSMITEIFNMVCAAADNNAPDGVILQVLKVLLIAVASNKFRVHGECLLSSIRTCYHIVLTSKNPINQATAKGTLTQMISIVFRRMELEAQEQGHVLNLEVKAMANTHDAPTAVSNVSEIVVENDVTDPGVPSQLEALESSKTAHISVEELQHLAGDADIKGLEAALVKAVDPDGGKQAPEGLDLDSMTMAQQDGLKVFRTLCKMSMKEEKDDLVTKTRVLSLELLQGLLENVSHSFIMDFRFIDSVKAYLCYALLRACVSSVATIFQLATNIFSVLLSRFRESLKAEIGVFFPLIVLRSLDNYESPLSNRTTVLRMLQNVCKDSQMLADIFVNYDCDLEATNLFERMVRALSRMAQGSPSSDPSNISLAQNASVRASSLQCLVSVLDSLVEWTKTHKDTRQPVTGSFSSSDEGLKQRGLHEDIIESEEIEGIQPDQFGKAKAHKSSFEAAIAEFNRKPDKGISFLVANNLIENTPKAIASFLLSTQGLNKAMIGEYLGQHEEFPLAVMHAYVDSMNFKGMKFDVAIREFLKGFRLPGEAQKIDRIMEKFAERYCCDNPSLFESADAAYVLAYAVIMLNTDAHNPMVWPKMTKADFLRMNSGSELQNGAPTEMLEEIYDSIVKDEIKLKDDSHSLDKGIRQKADTEERFWIVNILNLGFPRKKISTDAKMESDEIVKQTQALFKNKAVKRGVFYKAKEFELVKPMLETMGWPLLVAFSVTFEDTDNKAQVHLCMQGFRTGIHLTKILGMDTMRYALLTSLVRFTFLHCPKEMRGKNIEALRTLLALSETEPDALEDTWNAVLECVSRLEHITSTPAILNTVMIGANQISKDALASSLTELAGKPLEQIFVNSVKLPSDTIVEFFTGLCGVSAEELKQSPPRHFSLQKLVEISFYNMARIRMVWARIWLVLSQQFISAGSHQDEKIAMYAIDSLRQLGIKYLERAELTNFTFQNDILKPFVFLIRNSKSTTIRSLIVDCIVQMIKSKVGSIKSGWHSVFMVFNAAASDDTESIAEIAFENMEQVVLEHFDQIVGDCFMDCVHCLIAFANNKSCPRISLKAVALLRICEDRLAEGLIPGGASKPVQVDATEGLDVAEHYWFPMLVGLSELTSDPRTEVRNCALEVLFDVLQERGKKFSSSFWEKAFNDVLFPIFDTVRNVENNAEKSASADAWLRETCIHSLQLLCNLFNTFYKEVSFVLPSLLSLLLECAKSADQTVAHISVNALTHLMKVGGHQFNQEDWATILECLRNACYTTQPVELLSLTNSINYSYNTPSYMARESQSGTERTLGQRLAEEENLDDHDALHYPDGNASSFANGHSVENFRYERTDFDVKQITPGADGKDSSGGLSKSQTFGRALMDTILMKNLTLKGKGQMSESPVSSEKNDDLGYQDPAEKDYVSDVPLTIRSKCMTQLLFLRAIDSLQGQHWDRLCPSHQILIMDVLLSMVEFATSYNSYKNLRFRIRQSGNERACRPPTNLLRQENEGTKVYLAILNRAISEYDIRDTDKPLSNGSISDNDNSLDASGDISKGVQKHVQETAEERMVSFCAQILKEASLSNPNVGDVVDGDSFLAASLRSPIVVKVLNGLSNMEARVFSKHLGQFYPYFTKLICSEQIEIRRALGDLFKAQLISNLSLSCANK